MERAYIRGAAVGWYAIKECLGGISGRWELSLCCFEILTAMCETFDLNLGRTGSETFPVD